MKTLIKIIAGCVVTFLFLSLLFGGVNNAISTILISIICTGGVALLLWVPFFLAVGTAVVWIANSLFKVGKESKSEIGGETASSQYHKTLVEYIQQARNTGLKDDEIFVILEKNGWAENIIKETLAFK